MFIPSVRSVDRPLSENTLVGALRRLGIDKSDQTAHGVRAAASTLLNEQDWSPDLIELQLAHAPKDRIRAAYNRGLRIEERRRMMQHWADYLDSLRLQRKAHTAIRSK
jgi:integrase